MEKPINWRYNLYKHFQNNWHNFVNVDRPIPEEDVYDPSELSMAGFLHLNLFSEWSFINHFIHTTFSLDWQGDYRFGLDYLLGLNQKYLIVKAGLSFQSGSWNKMSITME